MREVGVRAMLPGRRDPLAGQPRPVAAAQLHAQPPDGVGAVGGGAADHAGRTDELRCGSRSIAAKPTSNFYGPSFSEIN